MTRGTPGTWAQVGAWLLVLASSGWAQPPVPVTFGHYLTAGGAAGTIDWEASNLKLTPSPECLRMEVEPKASGSAETVPLALAPLRLYTVTMTSRRGPGLGVNVFAKWLNAAGKAEQRLMVWQLPDRFRINWWPISALKTTYAQRFILPPGATQPTLRFELTGHPEAGYNYFDLHELSLATGRAVPYGTRLGPSLLPEGAMEMATATGMAVGWGFWGADPGAQVREQDPQGRPAHGGRGFLAFPAGKNCTLAGGNIPVQEGRAYRVSFWARGKGDLGMGLQSLEASQGQRVADAQQHPFRVEAEDWQQFSFDWFAESLWLDSANPFMGIYPQTEMDLDDLAFQLVEP